MSNENWSVQFGRIAPLYDELMHDVPYDRWADYLDELLQARRFEPKSILDLACGTGNMSERFAAKGALVTGIDISPFMIEQARAKASAHKLPIQYFTQDAAELYLPAGEFDLCVSLFDSLNYIVSPERLSEAIRRVAAHLTPGGLFIFDMNSEYALRNHFFDQSNHSSEASLRYDWVSEYDPETRICRIRMKFWYTVHDDSEMEFQEEHVQYAYRESEVIQMLKSAGFSDIKTYQAYTHRPPSRTSDRIFYVARLSLRGS